MLRKKELKKFFFLSISTIRLKIKKLAYAQIQLNYEILMIIFLNFYLCI